MIFSTFQSFSISKIELRIRFTNVLNAQLRKYVKAMQVFCPRSIELGHSGFRVGKTYFICRNSGLFSLLSTTASDLIGFNYPIKRVSLRFGGDYYKNFIFQNPWGKFFSQNSFPSELQIAMGVVDLRGAWIKGYKELDLGVVKTLARSIFQPSERVLELQVRLIQKYNLSTQSLIGVHFRGTDKVTETPTVLVEVYIEEVKKILIMYPNMEILLQSDSAHALVAFQEQFGKKVKYIKELPLSDNLVGAHTLEKEDRVKDAAIFIAAVKILADCRYLITHTGNGGLWEFIFRDSPQGFIQLSGSSFEKN